MITMISISLKSMLFNILTEELYVSSPIRAAAVSNASKFPVLIALAT